MDAPTNRLHRTDPGVDALRYGSQRRRSRRLGLPHARAKAPVSQRSRRPLIPETATLCDAFGGWRMADDGWRMALLEDDSRWMGGAHWLVDAWRRSVRGKTSQTATT